MKGASEYKNYIVINNNGIYGINKEERFISLEHIPSLEGFRGFGIQVPGFPDDIDWASFVFVVELCEHDKTIFARFKM